MCFTNSVDAQGDAKESTQQSSSQRLVTADGSYATQAAISVSSSKKESRYSSYRKAVTPMLTVLAKRFITPFRPRLRDYLMDGEFFIGATIATTLTKVALRYSKLCNDSVRKNVSFICLAR